MQLHFKLIVAAALLLIMESISSCGGSAPLNTTQNSPNTPPSIVVQPADQTVPIGSTATYSVIATGGPQLQYQWSVNGGTIPGATGPSYTTSIVEAQAYTTYVGSYSVSVSNATGSVQSRTATLSAGPRSPKAGDLRYLSWQQIDTAGIYMDGGLATDLPGPSEFGFPNSLGTPLTIGGGNCSAAGGCGWGMSTYILPPQSPNLSIYYIGLTYQQFQSTINATISTNVVINSLDLESPYNEAAFSWITSTQFGGFDYRLEVVNSSQIQSTIAQDGQESRIVTAVSFDGNGNANLISYGWQGDTSTVYDAQASIVASGDIAGEAAALAGEGYFISAFGGNDTSGYILVGMRVSGDSLPRQIVVGTTYKNSPPIDPVPPYFTRVVNYVGTAPITVEEQ